MKENWIVINRKTKFENLKKNFNMPDLTLRLLANRDISSKEEAEKFLNGTVNDLYDGFLMKDMHKAVDIIKDAIDSKKKIIIYGDYDCDGVCSTTILYKTLSEFNANFSYHIPDREAEGYGMSIDRIQKLYDDGCEVILTCDNGISGIEEVKFAKSLGITVIVTDHHDIPFIENKEGRIPIIPEADAVINPKQQDCNYPFKDLCGASVALKFSICLAKSLNKQLNCIEELIQFASLATVCDVVDLKDENRIIVKSGLKLIQDSQNKGLIALRKVTGMDGKTIGEYTYGFVYGPCINATGRLEIADYALELFVTSDENNANKLASKLHKLNIERQEITTESLEKVKYKLEKELKDEKVIVVYEPTIHESIVGIVAGRIREKYNLPTIVLTKGKDMIKGSGRSTENYNMYEELNKCKKHIYKFGGHPMAAGLSVKEEDFFNFKKSLVENCPLTDKDIIPVIKIDSPMAISNINENIIEQIEKLRPFGKGNPSPLLADKNIRVSRVYFMGSEKKFMKFRFNAENLNGYIEGVNFSQYDLFKEMYTNKFGNEAFLKLQDTGYSNFNMSIVYYPSINEFNGNRNIQLNIKNFRIE